MRSSCLSLLIAGSLSSGGLAITSEMQKVLDQHNVYRCMHAVPTLIWDDAIAANAQSWASNGVYKHSANSARVINGDQCGENLAWGYPQRSGVDSTIAWYSEIQYTNGGTPSSPTDTTQAGAGQAIGHYTAVVWKASTKVGCGKGTATVNGNSGDYWVCQYCTSGNFLGRFTENVLAPTVSESSCGGGSTAKAAGSNSGGGSGGNMGGGSSESPTPSPNPSSCTPSQLLPVGGLCVYGNQCASKFCCPRLKACLADANSGISSSDIKVQADHRDEIMGIVMGGKGTCSDPWSNGQKCMQTGEGKPLSSWDQTQCGCNAAYMTRYNGCSWVSLNTGVTCQCGAPAGTAGGAGANGFASSTGINSLNVVVAATLVLAAAAC